MEVDEREEEVDTGIQDAVDCFRDRGRICGPDCVAWVTYPSQDKGRLSSTQRHCLELSSLERSARHTTIIAATLADMYKKSRTAVADQQRKDSMGDTPKGGPFSDPFPVAPKMKL